MWHIISTGGSNQLLKRSVGPNGAHHAASRPWGLLNDRSLLEEFVIHGESTADGTRGQGEDPTPQILAVQLTLSQSGVADYAHHITTCPPPDFQT